jgi:DNA mismatch endonuclease (patch repair protein)
MADTLTPERRSALMRAIKAQDTLPERRVRSLLHALGDRFRLHRRDLPGTPDIVLPGRRCAVFVHGCFWHAHACRVGRTPVSRPEYGIPKLQANRARDARQAAGLEAAGWRVMVVWECALRDPDALARALRGFLGEPGPPAGRRTARRAAAMAR